MASEKCPKSFQRNFQFFFGFFSDESHIPRHIIGFLTFQNGDKQKSTESQTYKGEKLIGSWATKPK
jgi:hypothetical protein